MRNVQYATIINKGLKIASRIRINDPYLTKHGLSNADLYKAYQSEKKYIDEIVKYSINVCKRINAKCLSPTYILGFILSRNNNEQRTAAMQFIDLLCSEGIERPYILNRFREDLLRCKFAPLTKSNAIHLLFDKLYNCYVLTPIKLKDMRNYPGQK
jgi:hypothetical protein